MEQTTVTPRRFCVINEGPLAIGEIETGIKGGDETVQVLSVQYPDRSYSRDEPTRYRRFFGDDVLNERMASRIAP
jgi:hypothetical protein